MKDRLPRKCTLVKLKYTYSQFEETQATSDYYNEDDEFVPNSPEQDFTAPQYKRASSNGNGETLFPLQCRILFQFISLIGVSFFSTT